MMLSVTEVAEMLNVSRQMIHKLISNGELPYYKIGNLYRFEDEEITINSRHDMTNAIEIKGNEIVKAKNVD